MSKQKYTNYGNKFNKNDTHIAVAEVIDQAINEELGKVLGGTTLIDSGIGVIEDPSPQAEPIPFKPVFTAIVTANKLNIRKAPSKGAEVLTIVDKNTEVEIDLDYESSEWFKVVTAAGAEGYCMREFVEIK